MSYEKVVVTMARCVFPWQEVPSFGAELIHRPQGPGDTFRLRTLNGIELDLNGNSLEFVGLSLVKKGDA